MSEPVKPDFEALLRRVVMGWDTDDQLGFMAAIRVARRALRFTLADERENHEERDVLKANGLLEGDDR